MNLLKSPTIFFETDSDILSSELRDDILDVLRLQLLVHLEEVHALEGLALRDHRLTHLQTRKALLERPHTLLVLKFELLGVVVTKDEVEGMRYGNSERWDVLFEQLHVYYDVNQAIQGLLSDDSFIAGILFVCGFLKD
jgi:hypothetical protein